MRGGRSDSQQSSDNNMQQPDGQMMPNGQSNDQMMPGQSGNQTF